MVKRAQRLPIGVGGEPPVGDWVDVIVLQVIGPVAAGSGADVAVEVGGCSELESGAEHCGVPPTDVGNGMKFGAGVQNRLEERVPAEFPHQRNRDRPTPDDVAGLTVVGVTPPIRPQVTDDHEIARLALPLPPPFSTIRAACIERCFDFRLRLNRFYGLQRGFGRAGS